ncbi:hypothetical protein [Streptomyces sp. CO7]
MPAQQRQQMPPKPYAWAGGAAGIAVLLIALVWLPGPLSDLREYREAPECRNGRSVEGCRTVAAATVTGVDPHVHGGKRKYQLALRFADGSRSVLTMAGLQDGLGVTPREEAEAVLWRGSVAEVRQGADRDTVDGSRLLAWRPPLMLGAALAPVALSLLWTAGWLTLRQRRPGRPAEGREVLVPAAVWLTAGLGVVACVPIGFSAGGPQDVLTPLAWLYAGAAVVVAPVAAWLSSRPVRQRREMHIRPVPPTGEHVVPGWVLGDVPYSKEGFQYLVVGPGLLAATPDPAGRVARVRVPALRVTRVRASSSARSRPDGTCVAECRDGDCEVLVMARVADMPEVLGALGPAPS